MPSYEPDDHSGITTRYTHVVIQYTYSSGDPVGQGLAHDLHVCGVGHAVHDKLGVGHLGVHAVIWMEKKDVIVIPHTYKAKEISF